jgi:[acyl-carrier-protein] S-malonyltransferase
MALDLLEAGSSPVGELFALASEVTGMDMKALLGESEEVLKRTDLSQPAITLANLAAWACLKERGLEPLGCAGFSLGEYAALVAAAVISPADCFRLVKARGAAMRAAAERITGSSGEDAAPGMAAVIGLESEKVEELIGQWKAQGRLGDLYAANINSPRQTVVSGTAEALKEAAEAFKAQGARRFIRLKVGGPFHSPLIASAAEEFKPALEKVPFADPKIPLYSNVSGKRVYTGKEAQELALAQITSPVRWTEEEAAINAHGGIEAVLETGPGRTLQGLWKESGSPLACYPGGTLADIEALPSLLGPA